MRRLLTPFRRFLAARCDAVRCLSQSLPNGLPVPQRKSHHTALVLRQVVLYMENRPYDHFFGCMGLPGADSAATMTRNRSLPIDPTNASAGCVNVTCGTANYVCHGNMKYNIWSGKFANASRYGTPGAAHFPYAKQNDEHSFANGAQGHAIEMFSPAQLPVKTAIAKEFGVFNKLYSSVPSMSIPNHLFTQSATSCGAADNIMYSQCGGANATYPQASAAHIG
jgi:phospholipase C